jgi:hypothetical protein
MGERCLAMTYSTGLVGFCRDPSRGFGHGPSLDLALADRALLKGCTPIVQSPD